MRLTENELEHVMNVDWGLRFWHWFRWVLALVLLVLAIGGQLGLSRPIAIEWLVIGGVYVLVAWPGLCRAYVGRLNFQVQHPAECRVSRWQNSTAT